MNLEERLEPVRAYIERAASGGRGSTPPLANGVRHVAIGPDDYFFIRAGEDRVMRLIDESDPENLQRFDPDNVARFEAAKRVAEGHAKYIELTQGQGKVSDVPQDV